jgi:hypothetical protein
MPHEIVAFTGEDDGAMAGRTSPPVTTAVDEARRAAACIPVLPGAFKPRQQQETVMGSFEEIREHMEVIGADGVHIGTVDRVEENRIKLIRADSGIGHSDHHHYIPRGLVAEVEGEQVRLTARGDVVAELFEQEQTGEPIDD